MTSELIHNITSVHAVNVGFDCSMQAVGDGGQGWANALLFVIFSKNIRRRLFIEPLRRICIQTRQAESNTGQAKAAGSRPLQSEMTTAPTSHPVYYPSYTNFDVPYTNAFTSVANVSE